MNRPLVLVIDDEPVIRDFMTSSLLEQGYSVLAAGSGEEALRAAAAAGELALALIELRLPGCDATTLSRLLRRPRPGLRCGYITWAAGAGTRPLLPKPFSHSELAAFVERLLAGDGTPARLDEPAPGPRVPPAEALSLAGHPLSASEPEITRRTGEAESTLFF